MPFTLTVDLPNLGDQTLYIHGLGSFRNGVHKISDEQAAQFSQINSRSGYGPPDENGNMKIVSIPGPSLEDAVASMYRVSIERDSSDTATQNDTKSSRTGQDKPAAIEAAPEQATAPSGTEAE